MFTPNKGRSSAHTTTRHEVSLTTKEGAFKSVTTVTCTEETTWSSGRREDPPVDRTAQERKRKEALNNMLGGYRLTMDPAHWTRTQ